MRIIAGEFRGRPLRAPKGDGTRPTTDRVRESMMSSVHSAHGGFDGAVVLDAFAGSGALGLEALSRGAQSACFFEQHPEAFRVVQSNIKTLGLDARRARVQRKDVLKAPPFTQRPAFDLVFLDPPYAYEADKVLAMVRLLHVKGALSDDALIVYEHATSSNEKVDDAVKGYNLWLAQRKKYGDTIVDMLRINLALSNTGESINGEGTDNS